MDNLELINQGYEWRDGICLSFSLSFSCFSFPFKHQLFSQVLREPFLVQTDMNPERWWRKKTLWVFPELRGFVFTLILRLLLTAPPLFCFYAYSMCLAAAPQHLALVWMRNVSIYLFGEHHTVQIIALIWSRNFHLLMPREVLLMESDWMLLNSDAGTGPESHWYTFLIKSNRNIYTAYPWNRRDIINLGASL